MTLELKQRINNLFKDKVFNLLVEKNDIQIPKVMVKEEIQRMREKLIQMQGNQKIDEPERKGSVVKRKV
mgnify:CR=1 FL=1